MTRSDRWDPRPSAGLPGTPRPTTYHMPDKCIRGLSRTLCVCCRVVDAYTIAMETPQPAAGLRDRVTAILAEFHGKATTITEAGRENTRTVNRLARVVALRHAGTDKTFRQNLTRYRSEALEDDIVIGARREGNGVWSLVAELVPRD